MVHLPHFVHCITIPITGRWTTEINWRGRGATEIKKLISITPGVGGANENVIPVGTLSVFVMSERIVHQFVNLNSRKEFITAPLRSTREGNIYTWECLSVHHWWGRGTPSQVWVGAYPVPGLGWYPNPGLGGGGTPTQVWVGGYPNPGLGGGGTPSQVEVWVGGTKSQVWVGRYPIPGLGGYPGYSPLARSGWWGVPRVLPPGQV